MAKKAENKTKEQTVQELPEAKPIDMSQELPEAEPTDIPQELSTAEPEAEKPESADEKTSKVLNNDVELADEIPELEDLFTKSSIEKTQPEEQELPEERILFYIRTVNAKTAVRSTPEFPVKGDNIVGTIDNKEVYGITDVENGFGRLAERAGWVRLDSSVVTRLG